MHRKIPEDPKTDPTQSRDTVPKARKPWRRVVGRELLGSVGRRRGTRLLLECGHVVRVDFRRDGGSSGLEDRDKLRCGACGSATPTCRPN